MLIARVALPRCVKHGAFSVSRHVLWGDRTRVRHFSTPSGLKSSNDEVQVKVKIGLNQHVDLAIQQPPKPEANAPIILYLHRGLAKPSPHSPSTNELGCGANAVIVRLDYRVSKEEPYPFSIHSVLAGYDWVRTHLLPSGYESNGARERSSPRIGVCGELVGGSLATMLALTECHGEKRGGIKAAAVSNPVVDWTALVDPEVEPLGGTDMQTSLKSKSKATKLSQQVSPSNTNNDDPVSRNTLLSLRSHYFRKPEKYYDPFASPLLFFRTPRYAVPTPFVTMDASEAEYASPDEEPDPVLMKKRLSHRTYPPVGSGLVLPKMRLEVGEAGVLMGQGMEMAGLWRRSQEKQRDAVVDVKENALEDVVREGSGLWGERELGEVGRWLGKALRER